MSGEEDDSRLYETALVRIIQETPNGANLFRRFLWDMNRNALMARVNREPGMGRPEMRVVELGKKRILPALGSRTASNLGAATYLGPIIPAEQPPRAGPRFVAAPVPIPQPRQNRMEESGDDDDSSVGARLKCRGCGHIPH